MWKPGMSQPSPRMPCAFSIFSSTGMFPALALLCWRLFYFCIGISSSHYVLFFTLIAFVSCNLCVTVSAVYVTTVTHMRCEYVCAVVPLCVPACLYLSVCMSVSVCVCLCACVPASCLCASCLLRCMCVCLFSLPVCMHNCPSSCMYVCLHTFVPLRTYLSL